MLHPLPHEIASECLNTQAYVIPYLDHTRHQLLIKEMADAKKPQTHSTHHQTCCDTSWPHPIDFKASNSLFQRGLTCDTSQECASQSG